MTFYWNADSVCAISSYSGSGQSHTEYISCIFEATFYRVSRSKSADVVCQMSS